MTAKQIVTDAIERSYELVGTDYFLKTTQAVLPNTLPEILARVKSTDRASHFSPVDVVVGNKARDGALLLLEDRVVLAWYAGLLRPKPASTVISFSDISSVTEGTTDSNSREPNALQVHARQTWQLSFADYFRGGRSLVPLIAATLTGSATHEAE